MLAKRGHQVTVIERQESVAKECSYANGGQLSYSHAEPWASPMLLPLLPKWLIQKHSPLVIRPSFDLFLYKWLGMFLRNCTHNRNKQGTEKILQLAMYSRECMQQLTKELGLAFDYKEKGIIHIFRNQKNLDYNIQQSEFQKQRGCDYSLLSNKEIIQTEPALAHLEDKLVGGISFPLDATGNIHLFSQNLAKKMSTNGGNLPF